MAKWLSIQYRGFWDVPLVFLALYDREQYLFDCPFNEQSEEYDDHYNIYLLPEIEEDELPADWTKLNQRSERYLGKVPVRDVHFDPTRREAIDATILDELKAR